MAALLYIWLPLPAAAIAPQDGVVQHRAAGATLAIVVECAAVVAGGIAEEGDVGEAGAAGAAVVPLL